MLYMGRLITFIVGWILAMCITELFIQGFFDPFWECLKNHFDKMNFSKNYYLDLRS